MTERPPSRRGPDRVVIWLLSATTFLLLLAFLAFQLRESASASSAASEQRRPILLRRVYETKVVERVPARVPEGSSTSESSSSEAQAAPPAPMTRAS